MMRRLDATTPLFDAALDQLLEFVVARDPQVVTTVSAIIDAVQRRGDAALLEYTNRYDCLLYTSDAADERSSVDLGGRRIIKKKKT